MRDRFSWCDESVLGFSNRCDRLPTKNAELRDESSQLVLGAIKLKINYPDIKHICCVALKAFSIRISSIFLGFQHGDSLLKSNQPVDYGNILSGT